MMIRAGIYIGSFLVILGIFGNACASRTVTADQLSRALFIGQAYVSGNVYLKGFSGKPRTDWPARVVAVPLRPAGGNGITGTLELAFSHVVNASGSDEYSNFPVKERAPGEDEFRHPPDIFRTVLDSPLEDRDIAVYRAKGPIPAGFSVLAWGPGISLGAFDFGNAGKPRPMTGDEKREVADRKKEAGTKTKGHECTTVPGFVDSAREILRARVEGSAFSIRVSEYANPGCWGHLEEVYVLDVKEDGKAPRRFEFHHYFGAI